MNKPTVDLTNCDREPIHIPGSIQPQGCLLACGEAQQTIHRRSDNAGALLGLDGLELIGKSLPDLFGPETSHTLANALAQTKDGAKPSLMLALPINGRTFDVAAHRYKGQVIIELEPSPPGEPRNPLHMFRTLIDATVQSHTIDAALAKIPRLMHGLFRYDRVMIYRFSHDGSGKVVAEHKRSDLEGFLGQHFPATDIPQQARALYVRNTIRVIADASGERVPISPELDASGEPLDLSFAHLRSVSPIHCEYLRNMGVAASMSVSIIIEGKLWGLVACHHYAPHALTMAERVAAELYGEYLSLQLEAISHRARLDTVSNARRALDRMMRDVSYHGDIAGSLKEKIDDFFNFMECDGVGIWIADKWSATGATPPAPAIVPLINFIASVSDRKVWATHELSAHFAAAAAYSGKTAGLLAVPLSQKSTDYLIFFRREIVQTVNWAGDPNKTYESGPLGDRLTPRKSFAIWKETVERQSQPWSEDDREIAEATRSALLEIIMRHTEIVETERQTATVRQKLLNEELNHRVKNILSLIKSLVSQPVDEGRDIASYIDTLKGRIMALSFAHDQVMRSDGGGDLKALLNAELGPYQETTRIELDGAPVTIDARAYAVMALVIHEMATNAAKYGALSQPTGQLHVKWALKPNGACEIAWRESGGPRVAAPTRQGFGNVLLSRSIPFDLRGESEISYELTGLAARFLIPAQFVGRQSPIAAGDKSEPMIPTRGALRASTVLLVEDQLLIAMEAESALLDSGVKTVDTVATVEDALRVLSATTPDVCVLDVNLGAAATSIPVADHLVERKIPFVFATGYHDSIVIPAHLKHIPTVRKPYHADTLTSALAKVLEVKSAG